MSFMKVFISIVLIAGVMSGFGIFYAGVTDNYGLSNSTIDFTSLNSTGELEDQSKTLTEKAKGFAGEPNFFTVFDLAGTFLFSVIGILGTMGSIFTGLVGSAGTMLMPDMVPSWFLSMLVVIGIVFFTILLISFILRRDV